MTEIEQGPDELTLKWGTLKAWQMKSQAGQEALKRFFDAGDVTASAMMHRNSDGQIDAICDMIDATAASGGEIWNDWVGVAMTPEDAKKYVREYGK